MKKIITHDGIFHADEIFAIALLQTVRYDVPIVRTRDLAIEDIQNPDVWILDVGKQHDDILHNFDHHQDTDLPSTNVLILMYLFNNKYIVKELLDILIEPFTQISNIDCGGYEGMNGFQVNSLIKSFNFVEDGWHLSLEVATAYIKSCISRVKENERSMKVWDEGENITSLIFNKVIDKYNKVIGKYCHEFPVNWKSYDNGINFLIYPKYSSRQMLEDMYQDNEFILLTKDSVIYPIHSNGKEKFLHNAKFIAVFESRKDAEDAVIASYYE